MKNPAQQNPQRTLWKKTSFVVVMCFCLTFLALFLFLSITPKTFAANGINRVINFQGKIVNKSDSTNITNGTYSFTFKMYDAASSGNLLWQETQSSVTVTNGIFQVSLGSVTPFNGGGYNVNFNQNNLYLDITFNSETFGTRIQLATVPYAINSEQLDGVIATQSATGFNLSGGMSTPSVASFTTAGSTLTFQPGVAEALTIQSNGGNALTLDTGSGATLNIANNNATAVQFGGSQNPTFTFSGTGTFTTSSGLNTLGGNVQVNGSTISLANASSSTIQTTGTNTGLTMLSNGSGNITLGQNLGNGNIVITPNAGGQAALMVIDQGTGDLFTASAGANTKFVINASGNVGIGTAIAGYKLEVDAGSYNTSLGIVSNDSVGPGLTLNNTGTNGHKYDLTSTGNGSALGAGDFGIYDETNNVYKLVIDYAGDVSINTNTPASILDVRGVGTNTLSGTIPIASFSGRTSFAGMVVDNKGTGDLFTASSSGLNRFVITQNGNVGIGTTNPSFALDVNGDIRGQSTVRIGPGSGEFLQVQSGDNFDMKFFTANAERMRIINNTGSFGINTKSPLALLDIRGTSGTNTISGTLPVASLSAKTSFASLVVDNSGVGDIFTASSSGLNRFVITQNGNVGIATTTPGANLQVGGTGSSSNPAYLFLADFSNGSNGNGNAVFVGNWVSSKTWGIGAATNLSDNTLRIGNTSGSFASPSNTWQTVQNLRLVLNGTLGKSAQAALDVAAATGILPIASLSGQTSFAGLVVDNSGVGDLFTASSSGLNRFVITQNGNVGIGTTTPGYKLDINTGSVGALNAPAIVTNFAGSPTCSSASQCYTGLQINDTHGGNSNYKVELDLQNSGTNQFSIGQDFNAQGQQNFFLEDDVASKVRLGIDSNGDIGINANTAGISTNAILDVRGIGNATLLGTIPVASISGKTSAAGLVIDNSGNGDLFTASASGATRFVVNTNGNVGVGTRTPKNALDVNGSVAIGTYAGTNTSGQANSLIVSGRIGIGVTNPGSSLDISGGINATGSINANAIGDFTGFTSSICFKGCGSTTLQVGGQSLLGLGVNGASPLATLDVRSTSYIQPTASISGATGMATLVLDQSGGAGDIFAASSSGLTRFRITNTGNVVFQGGVITSVGTGGTANASGAVINALGDQGSMIPNAGFESASTGIGPADGWAVAATDSAAVFRVATDSAKGNNSLWVKLNNNSAAVYSTCIPLAGQNTVGSYTLNYYAGNFSGNNADFASFVDWYTTQSGCQTGTSPTFVSTVKVAPAAGNWVLFGSGTTAITVPTGNPRWARVHFFVSCTSCSNSITHIDGVRLTEKDSGQGVDYAENYPADPLNTPQPGALAELTTDANGHPEVIPATLDNNDSLLGVVSSHPGEVLDDGSMQDPKVPVALAGRIPTNVSTKNGPIHLGDYLTVSDIPGVAVKATKAGQVIGVAMEDDSDTNPNNVKQVVMFVKNTYFAGISTTQGVSDALSELGTLEQKAETTNTTNLSTVNTDRLIAGLDVITPKLIAESVFTNTISASSGHDITISLNDGSLIIKNHAESSVVQFDNQGNVFIKGTLTADTIQANHIRGLDIMANQITQLSSQISSLSANLNVLGAETTATDAATQFATMSGTTVDGLTVTGLATISGDLRIKGNALFESMLSVIDTLSANNFIVNGISDFFSSVIFHGNVQFAQPPVFSSNTAGNATIVAGQNHVNILFTNAYQVAPIVTTNIANNDQVTSQAILANGYTLVVTNITNKGFTVLLNKTAGQDITISWIAVAVQNSQVFSLPTPTPIIDENTNPATGSAKP